MVRRSDTDADGTVTRRRLLAVAGGTAAASTLAGCQSASTPTETERPPEGTVTITLANRDDAERPYEVAVNQGEELTDSFSGVLPSEASVQMVATFRVTDAQYDFTINVDGAQRGRTWDPTECAEFVVDATVENAEPRFEARCADT